MKRGATTQQKQTKVTKILVALASFCSFLLFAFSTFAEQRFPPPEFETGYTLPKTTTPGPRALWTQYGDVLVLAAALGVACYLIYRRRSRKGLIALSIFSLAYFGFYRNGCICAIGSVQNIALALGDNGYSVPLSVLGFFVLPLLVALFAGRTFCAGVCPHGALQDLLLIKPIKVPPWLEQGLSIVPFLYLGAAVLFASTGSAFLICRYDPFVPLFRFGGSFLLLGIGAAFVLASLFVGRPYCRFLCPYGALLRVTSLASKWRVTVTPTICTQCRLCEESCPFGAMRYPKTEAPAPAALVLDRRRLTKLLVALPLIIVACGWLGSQLSVAFSQVNKHVALAERVPGSNPVVAQPGNQNASELSLARAQQDPKAMLTRAVEIRHRFASGGWWFGGFVGLVLGVKLISLSLQARRTDYEPDRGACVACARCFMSCPNEHARRGLVATAVSKPAEAVTS
jgi:ferredoxin